MFSKNKILGGFLRAHISTGIWALIFVCLSNLLAIVLPISIGKFYSLLFDYSSYRSSILNGMPAAWFSSVPNFLLFFAILLTAKTIIDFAFRYTNYTLGEKFTHALREQLYWAQIRLPVSNYAERGTGKFLLRWSGDLAGIKQYLTLGIIRFTGDLLFLLFLCAVLLFLELNIFFIFILGFCCLLAFMFLINYNLYRKDAAKRDHQSQLIQFIDSRIRAIRTVQALNREQPEYKQFRKRSDKLLEAGKTYFKSYSWISSAAPNGVFVLIGILMLSVYLLKSQNKSIGSPQDILICILLIITFIPTLKRLLKVSLYWRRGALSFEKLLSLLNHTQLTQTTGKNFFIVNKGLLTIEDLHLIDQNSSYIFSGYTLKTESKGIHKIVLESEIQAHCLIQLLTGILVPDEGRILIDSQDITKTDLKSLRKQIGVLSDVFPLLGNKVFQAISYSRKKEKKQRAEKILNRLQAAIPEPQRLRLDTRILQDLSNLSKEQKKLLCYARAFLSRKPILFIVDPFTDLSPASAAIVASMLEAYASSKSIYFLEYTRINETKPMVRLFQKVNGS